MALSKIGSAGLDTLSGNLIVEGNVGVGTSSPDSNLHVLSTTLPQVKIDYNGTYYTTISNNGALNVVDPGTDNKWVFLRNGTEQMRIDSAGRVTMPYQPSFFVARTNNFTFTGNDQSQPMVFDLVNRNIGGHYNSSTGLFTAPVSGNYCFASGGYTSVNLSQMWFIVNGVRTETYAMFDSTEATQSGSGIVYLTAGDTLGIHYYVNTGSVTLYQNTNHTFFRGFLVG